MCVVGVCFMLSLMKSCVMEAPVLLYCDCTECCTVLHWSGLSFSISPVEGRRERRRWTVFVFTLSTAFLLENLSTLSCFLIPGDSALFFYSAHALMSVTRRHVKFSESETNRYVRDLPPKGWSIIAVMMTSSVSVEYRGKTRLRSQVKGISARHKVYPYPVYIRKTCLLYSVFCWLRDGSSKSLRRIGDLMCTYYLKSPLVSHSDLLPVDEKRKLPVCQTCSERMQYSTDQRKHVSKSESISQLVFCFSPLL